MAVRVRAVVERRRLQRELRELQASFTSMLVHDLRAPLTIIKGYADLFEATSGPLTAKQQRYLKSMQESCVRMLRLIRDNKWNIRPIIEFEYKVPEGSTRVAEIKKCLDYCREALTS